MRYRNSHSDVLIIALQFPILYLYGLTYQLMTMLGSDIDRYIAIKHFYFRYIE